MADLGSGLLGIYAFGGKRVAYHNGDCNGATFSRSASEGRGGAGFGSFDANQNSDYFQSPMKKAMLVDHPS